MPVHNNLNVASAAALHARPVGDLPLARVQKAADAINARGLDPSWALRSIPPALASHARGFDEATAYRVPLHKLGAGAGTVTVLHVKNAAVDEMQIFDDKNTLVAHGQKGELPDPARYEFDLMYSIDRPVVVVRGTPATPARGS